MFNVSHIKWQRVEVKNEMWIVLDTYWKLFLAWQVHLSKQNVMHNCCVSIAIVSLSLLLFYYCLLKDSNENVWLIVLLFVIHDRLFSLSSNNLKESHHSKCSSDYWSHSIVLSKFWPINSTAFFMNKIGK